MDEPHIDAGPDPAGDPDVTSITADQLEVASLRRSASIEGAWTLSSRAPLFFGTEQIEADDEDEAIAKAKARVADYVRVHGLFDDDEDEGDDFEADDDRPET